MSKPANKTAIGIFVVIALVLAVVAVLTLGSGKFFKTYPKFVMYFQGSVKGLQVGAPVAFRGVKVGTVSEIKMLYNPKDLSFIVPVYVELGEGNLEMIGIRPGEKVKLPREQGEQLIKLGLRAQLEMQSIVTGQLMIALDFYPDTPAKLVGIDRRYPEIPTIPTALQALTSKLEKIPLDEIIEKFRGTLAGIDKVVNSPEMAQIMKSAALGVDETRALIKNVDSQIKPLAAKMDDTAGEIKKLAADSNKAIGPLAASLTKTSEEASAALKTAQATMISMEKMAGDRSPLAYKLSKTIEELDRTARSLRILTETLDLHPESLLYGKKDMKEGER